MADTPYLNLENPANQRCPSDLFALIGMLKAIGYECEYQEHGGLQYKKNRKSVEVEYSPPHGKLTYINLFDGTHSVSAILEKHARDKDLGLSSSEELLYWAYNEIDVGRENRPDVPEYPRLFEMSDHGLLVIMLRVEHMNSPESFGGIQVPIQEWAEFWGILRILNNPERLKVAVSVRGEHNLNQMVEARDLLRWPHKVLAV